MTVRIPSLMSGVDVFSLPLSTKEGFILSRIDGLASVEDISMMVGVAPEELLQILERLAQLRAVKLPWRADPVAPGKPGVGTGRRSDPHAPPAAEGGERPADKPGAAAVARVLAEPAHTVYDPLELLAKADIDLEIKKRILNVFYGADGKDYYQTLGVSRQADKKEIKSAYFELSKLFHPDTLFGKELGPFKSKMEVVFKRLTEAYEVLGRNARRKEYDEYLAATAATHAINEQLEQVALPPEPPAQQPEPEEMLPPPAAAPVRESPAPRAAQQRATPIDLRPPPTLEQRRAQARERLRRGLPGMSPGDRASQRPAAAGPSLRPPPSAAGGTEAAATRRDSAIKGLRQGLRASASSANRVDPVLAQLKKAQDAERGGDMLSAASALQAALALDPHRAEIQQQYARVSAAVSLSLADNYEKQARYEEKMGKWPAAAQSWEQVAQGRPNDVAAARSAAEALLKAGGDLHRAQRHAQRAVDLAPSDVTNVVVLARVLLAAGLRLNAKRELEKAVKLDPQNEMIRNLLREVR